jgi:hypothetical protein
MLNDSSKVGIYIIKQQSNYVRHEGSFSEILRTANLTILIFVNITLTYKPYIR